jgi:hypothetical protein
LNHEDGVGEDTPVALDADGNGNGGDIFSFNTEP